MDSCLQILGCPRTPSTIKVNHVCVLEILHCFDGNCASPAAGARHHELSGFLWKSFLHGAAGLRSMLLYAV
jgi:hypothetical protein